MVECKCKKEMEKLPTDMCSDYYYCRECGRLLVVTWPAFWEEGAEDPKIYDWYEPKHNQE